MYSRTAIVCIVDLVDLIRVGWHATYAEELLLQWSLVGGSSTSLFLDLSGLAWYPSCPITSGKLASSGLQCYISECWPP